MSKQDRTHSPNKKTNKTDKMDAYKEGCMIEDTPDEELIKELKKRGYEVLKWDISPVWDKPIKVWD